MATIDKFVEADNGISCTFGDDATLVMKKNDCEMTYVLPFMYSNPQRQATRAEVIYYTAPFPYIEDASREERMNLVVQRLHETMPDCGWVANSGNGSIALAIIKIPAVPYDAKTQYWGYSFLSGKIIEDGLMVPKNTGASPIFAQELMQKYEEAKKLPLEIPVNLQDLITKPAQEADYNSRRRDAGPAS